MRVCGAWKQLAAGLAAGLLLCLIAFCALDQLFPFPYERLAPPSSTRILDRRGVELRRFLAEDSKWRFPVALDEVTPELVTALVESEDRWFYFHPGVNPLAVLRAVVLNLSSGRIVSGASTIPMQIARMAEPKARTVSNKLIEIFRAMQLSLRYSKAELLEIYLNLAPFGGNIEGVGAASVLYFNKTPDQLSLGESALLAVLPRAPNRYNPARNPEAAMEVRDRVLGALAERGVVDGELAEAAMRQPMVAVRRTSPMMAPHFTLLAKKRLGGKPAISTTLDMRMQRTLETLVSRHAERIRPHSISNLAAVVLDRTTRQVLALAGSADFFDDSRQGQVNNALAPRSPGSTLKPFLYALAFDKGLALPQTALLDVPTDFAGYAPENYSGTFSGKVTVADALARSLNVPAVRLLARTGLNDYFDLLKQGGLTTLDRPAATYGLPLVLGGCEARLIDLTNLYATLAEGGVHRPWRVVPQDTGASQRLFSPEAARAVCEMLTEVTRPDMPESWRLTLDRPAVAWKTGTSFGHRDAWAVGFGGSLAVGVWVGNPDGTPAKGISGSIHAGPLLFDLLRALEKSPHELHLPEVRNKRRITLCAVSSELAGPDCPDTIEAYSGPTLNLSRCSVHKRCMVDEQSGLRLVGDCLLQRTAKSQVFEVVGPELAAWLASQGKTVPSLPAMSPECDFVPGGNGPVMRSPAASTPYLLHAGLPAEYQKLPLQAETSRPDQRLWWYVDGEFVGVSRGGEQLFWQLVEGEHRAGVTDESGRTTTVDFTVTTH